MSQPPRILILGCGGIGGQIAAGLLRHGHTPTVVTHNPRIAAAIQRQGFRLRVDDEVDVVPGTATAEIPHDAGPFDLILLATQPPQLAEAVQTALPLLEPYGAFVCFQNGLCEQRVAEIAGDEHVLGAVVAWGGSMPEPGLYDRTSEGGFVIGRLDGKPDDRLDALRDLLEPIGRVDVTRNLAGARWSKLAINCAISTLGTVGGNRLGTLIRHRFVRRMALEVMSEAVAVARRRDVELEKVSGTIDLEWVALGPGDLSGPGSPSLVAKHALLLAVGAKFRRLRSSMLAAIEQGKTPAVDFLNGEVTRHGEALDIPTPLNAHLQATVHAIARGEQRPGELLLRRVFECTRRPVHQAILQHHGQEPPRRASGG